MTIQTGRGGYFTGILSCTETIQLLTLCSRVAVSRGILNPIFPMWEGSRKKRHQGSSASCAFTGWSRQNAPSYKQLLFAVAAAQAVSMHFQATVNVQGIITETLYTAPSSSRVEMFSAKIFYCIFSAFYTSCQWNSNTIMLSSGEETLYVEIQNWCMLNLQASSLELWMHMTTVQRNAHSPGISPGGPWSFPNFGVKWSILAVGDSLVENSLFT